MLSRKVTIAIGVLLLAPAWSAATYADELKIVAPVAIPQEALKGEGLEAVPSYRAELTLAGLQQLSARELFRGAIVIDVLETQDGGTLLLKDYPFDQYVQVLAGTTTLKSIDGSSRTFVAGDSFVVPRGYKGEWTLSKGFREVLIIETRTLQEGVGQFEK